MNIMGVINEIRHYRALKNRNPHVIVVDNSTFLRLIDDMNDLQYHDEKKDGYMRIGGVIVVEGHNILDLTKVNVI